MKLWPNSYYTEWLDMNETYSVLKVLHIIEWYGSIPSFQETENGWQLVVSLGRLSENLYLATLLNALVEHDLPYHSKNYPLENAQGIDVGDDVYATLVLLGVIIVE